MAEYLAPGVYVEEVPSAVQAIAGVGTSTAGFIGIFGDSVTVLTPNPDYDPTAAPPDTRAADRPARAGRGAAARTDDTGAAAAPPTDAAAANPRALPYKSSVVTVAAAGDVQLCTNFSEFKQRFGDFSNDEGQSRVAHAVFGFFNNGGRRCHVVRVADEAGVQGALEKFEAIDEIAIVAVPGSVSTTVRGFVTDHCDRTGDRFAILDSPDDAPPTDAMLPPASKNAAFYYPWIAVFDPVLKLQKPDGDGQKFVPPSGHVAGIYARCDNERGVHKAPANEVVRGALGVKIAISKNQQAGLNPRGINCIRDMNGNLRVWGARTVGGDANGEWKYVNVRRLFLYLRESIDEGTQWVVFEPNTPSLWAKITRNVTAFLTNVWRDGALFGNTPAEAFYVKCDAETNPASERELGRVITEIGVAIVRPAEFVIFRISQWAGPEAK